MRRLALAVAIALLAPATASASTVRVDSGPSPRYPTSLYAPSRPAVYYKAAPGERNRLLVAYAGDAESVTVTDPGAVIEAGDMCTSLGAHSARCIAEASDSTSFDTSFIQHTEARLGDRRDEVHTTRPTPYPIGGVAAFGGRGDDVLVGGPGGDELSGGRGRDQSLGGADEDVLIDGESASRGGIGSAADVMDGGPARDFVAYDRRTRRVKIDLQHEAHNGRRGENDVIRNTENAIGGAGRDRLLAGESGSDLRGGRGADVLVGRGGDDTLYGGAARDRLSGRGGTDLLRPGPGLDALFCGAGSDAVVDPAARELLRRQCETAHALAVFDEQQSFAFRPTPVAISRRAVVFELPCPEDELDSDSGSECDARVAVRTAGARLLARGRYASAGPATRVRLRLTKLGRRLSGRRGGVRGTVSVGPFPNFGDDEVTVAWTVRLSR